MTDNEEKKDPKTSFRNFVELYGWDENKVSPTNPRALHITEIFKKYQEKYRKNYPALLLRDLLDGKDRKMNQYVWRMVDGKLYIVAQELTEHKEVLLNSDMSLNGFIELALEQFDMENDIDKT